MTRKRQKGIIEGKNRSCWGCKKKKKEKIGSYALLNEVNDLNMWHTDFKEF